jgi:predicted phage tail protein
MPCAVSLSRWRERVWVRVALLPRARSKHHLGDGGLRCAPPTLRATIPAPTTLPTKPTIMLDIVIGIVFIIGGLSGRLAFIGTDSGTLLAIFGAGLVVWGVVKMRRAKGKG